MTAVYLAFTRLGNTAGMYALVAFLLGVVWGIALS